VRTQSAVVCLSRGASVAQRNTRAWAVRRAKLASAVVASLVLAVGAAELEAQEMQAQAEQRVSRIAELPPQRPFYAVSPDGSLAVELGAAGSLVIRDLASGETRALTKEGFPQGAMSAVFSPEGTQIGYTWLNEAGFFDLRVIGVDGSGPQIVYSNPDVRYMAAKSWSPDGERVLVAVQRQDISGHLSLISVSDGSLRDLTSLEVRPRLQLDSSPVWGESPKTAAFSPDGRFIAYDVSAPGTAPDHDIFLLAVDGSRRASLVEDQADDLLLGWSAGGGGIVFASDREGSVDLWLLPIEDGEPQESPHPLRRELGQLEPVGVGQGVTYYAARRGRCELYLVALDPETGTFQGTPRFVGPAFHRSGVDWSPDSKQLAYVTTAGGVSADTWVMVVRSLETDIVRKLSFNSDMLHWARPQWSPDGRFLLAKGWDPNAPPGESVYRIDVVSGEVTTLTRTESLWERMIDWVGWWADGSAIFYLVPPPGIFGTTRVIRLDLASGQESELFQMTVPPFLYALNASPDRRYLGLALWDQAERRPKLRIVPVSDGETQEIVGAWDLPLWSADSQHLMYKDTAQNIWRMSVQDGERTSPGSLELPAGLEIDTAAGSISPDGRWLALIVQEPFYFELWRIENLTSE